MEDSTLKIIEAKAADRTEVIALLKTSNLPTDDLPLGLNHFFVASKNGKLIGVVGLEVFGIYGLLRSLAVAENQRGTGLGKKLYSKIMSEGKTMNLAQVFIITNTADKFFERLDFEVVHRKDAPEVIQQTAQFSTLCPSSAIVMRKIV